MSYTYHEMSYHEIVYKWLELMLLNCFNCEFNFTRTVTILLFDINFVYMFLGADDDDKDEV